MRITIQADDGSIAVHNDIDQIWTTHDVDRVLTPRVGRTLFVNTGLIRTLLTEPDPCSVGSTVKSGADDCVEQVVAAMTKAWAAVNKSPN